MQQHKGQSPKGLRRPTLRHQQQDMTGPQVAEQVHEQRYRMAVKPSPVHLQE